METNKFIHELIYKMKPIQNIIHEFLKNEEFEEDNFQKLINYNNSQKISSNPKELKLLLHLLSKFSNNHHRTHNFFVKIGRILTFYQSEIKNFFTNFEIFDIFKNNKRILLFLFEEKIVIPDIYIYYVISSNSYKEKYYPQYLMTEFEAFFHDKKEKEETFEQKRRIGENDDNLCQIIRNDSKDEFVKYVNENLLSLSETTIKPSIYETNSILIKTNPTLIEYSAFFGSIEIFKYLLLNKVDVRPILWLYSIHGDNVEMIHLLEENQVEPPKNSFVECYKESIKCNHIEMMNYIHDKYLQNEQDNLLLFNLQFYNFEKLSEIDDFEVESKSDLFFDFCKYDYYQIVDFILKNTEMNINTKRI